MDERVQTLEDLLDTRVSDFFRQWVERTTLTSEDVHASYALLMSYGINKKTIARHPNVIILQPAVLRRRYRSLRALGIPETCKAALTLLLTRKTTSVLRNYRQLCDMGLSPEKIAAHAHILSEDTNTIKKNYDLLLSIGLPERVIKNSLTFLVCDPSTLQSHYEYLHGLGFADEHIWRAPRLLMLSPESLDKKYLALKKLGLSPEQIRRFGTILVRNTKAVQSSYEHHIGLRLCGSKEATRKFLFNNPNLLSMSKETMLANVQYLSERGIRLNIPRLLSSTPEKKRSKEAWLLQNVFTQGTFRERVQRMRDYVRKDDEALGRSLSLLASRDYSTVRYAGKSD